MDPNKLYTLDRRSIVGLISESTPRCVLEEIAGCHGLKVAKDASSSDIVNAITELKVVKITTLIDGSLSSEQFKTYSAYIARYTGYQEISWDVSSLLQAFNHLRTYSINCIPELPQQGWVAGPKTKIAPFSYDACILYRICVYNNITMTPTTTFSDLTKAVNFLIEGSSELRKYLSVSVASAPLYSLISVYLSNLLQSEISPLIEYRSNEVHTDMLPEKADISYSKLVQSYNNLIDINQILLRLAPTSHEEAVIISALVYSVNITESSSPILEFNSMKTKHGKTYIPVDPLFMNSYMKNPHWYDVKRVYEPRISMVYSLESLRLFLISEGCQELTNNMSREDMLSKLYHYRVINTFYCGRHPRSKNDETMITQESFSDIDNKLIVSYGCCEDNDMFAYKIDELTEYFSRENSFTNPYNVSEQFSEVGIRKLKIICEDAIKNSPAISAINELNRDIASNTIISRHLIDPNMNGIEKDAVTVEYERLLYTINKVELFIKNNLQVARDFLTLYKKSTDIQRTDIKGFFDTLLECGLYMRGWKVSGEGLPVRSEETQFTEDRTGKVFLNVTRCIRKLERRFNSLPGAIKDRVDKLPLLNMQIRDGGLTFRSSNYPEDDGATIMDRINIVKEGKKNSSCIRVSSNWIVSSSWYYLDLIGYRPSFNIRDLGKIS